MICKIISSWHRFPDTFSLSVQAAAPKKWKGPDGKMTEMDTVYTMRAQELRDIYSSINMKYLTQDERLDVLLTLKHTVKVRDYSISYICGYRNKAVDILGVPPHFTALTSRKLLTCGPCMYLVNLIISGAWLQADKGDHPAYRQGSRSADERGQGG